MGTNFEYIAQKNENLLIKKVKICIIQNKSRQINWKLFCDSSQHPVKLTWVSISWGKKANVSLLVANKTSSSPWEADSNVKPERKNKSTIDIWYI